MNGESASIGSLSLRISAAKSNCGFFRAPGGIPPVDDIRTTRPVRSGQYSANVWAMILPSEWPTRSAFCTDKPSSSSLMS